MKSKQWKKTTQIQEELVENSWRDDTLSPLSQKPYWQLCSKLVPGDEKVVSILFAKSVPMSLIQKVYLFVVTDKNIWLRTDYGGFISNPKKILFENIKSVNLFQDKYLPSFIYVDINFNGLRKGLYLQSFDPTSVLHFKEKVLEKKNKILPLNS